MSQNMIDTDDQLVGFETDEPQNNKDVAIPKTLQEKYHAILQKSPRNGCGNFQIIASVTVMLCLIGFGYIEYGLGYLELMPQFICNIGGVE
jgi:hypothetical protein